MRHCVANQGLPEEEHFFFRREMSFAARSGSWMSRAPYRLFGLISDYGHSILRPTLGLLALWLIPAMFFLIAFAWLDVLNGAAWRGVEPFSLSFASIFKIFGFHGLYFGSDYMQDLPMWMQALSGFQTIMGFVLLFFLGLGLRQRFRLR